VCMAASRHDGSASGRSATHEQRQTEQSVGKYVCQGTSRASYTIIPSGISTSCRRG
jgi:hypothetical protein